jgi:hypothetical protein
MNPARTDAEAAALLERIFPDPKERARYADALRRLIMRPVTPARLAQRARLQHRAAQVRAALREDARLRRVREPIDGPERYELRPEHRHAAALAREARA